MSGEIDIERLLYEVFKEEGEAPIPIGEHPPRWYREQRAKREHHGGHTMSMKTATFKELQRQTAACIEAAQDGPVIITRYGQPVGLLTGIKGYDWEDVYYMTNKAFRREIERARAQPARPIEEVWDELYDGE